MADLILHFWLILLTLSINPFVYPIPKFILRPKRGNIFFLKIVETQTPWAREEKEKKEKEEEHSEGGRAWERNEEEWEEGEVFSEKGGVWKGKEREENKQF